MSSTDEAFIKAYNDTTRNKRRVDPTVTKSQSFVVAPRHFRVSQFVTDPVIAPTVSDSDTGNIDSSATDASGAEELDGQDATASDAYESQRDTFVNIRLDGAEQSVVPAPHFAAKKFVGQAEETGLATEPGEQTASIDGHSRDDRQIPQSEIPKTKSNPFTENGGELELIELRIDIPISNIVPAPHFPVGDADSTTQPQTQSVADSANVKPRDVPPSQSVRPLNVGTPTLAPNDSALANAMSRLRPNQVASPAPLPVREPSPTSAFVPGWEVDSFQWPAVCDQLDSLRSQSISNFVRAVLADAWQGTRVVAVTEFGRGEGATTLSLCLAKWAAMFTGRVAIVDGDIMQPRIADSLGIAVGRGWEESSPTIPVCETAVASVEDRLVAVPLGPKSGLLAADADRSLGANMLRELAGSFELVVLDAGPMFDAAYHWFAEPSVCAIDSVFVVQDVRSTSVEQVSDVRRRLVDQGLQRVSVVENFRAG